MTRSIWCLTLLLSGAAAFAAPAAANDWPQWQGADRDAVQKETGLLKSWPKQGPPLAWKVGDLGGGYSAPSIANGKIFGMSRLDGKDFVWARSEKDGQAIWSAELEEAPAQGMPQGQEGPACTPTVNGDYLYVICTGGEVACLSVAVGKVVWHRSMVKDFGGSVPTWNYRESPLVDGDKVICTPGASDAMMVALDKLTGKTIWKTQMAGGGSAAGGGSRPGPGGGTFRESGASYSSAIAFDFAGQRQYAQMTSTALIGVAAADGKLLWQYAKPANVSGINCTTPIYHDGMVFATSAYAAGAGVVKLIKTAAGGINVSEVWFSRRMQNHHGGVILLDGDLYGANGGNEGGAALCMDFKTGDILWNQRNDSTAAKGSVAFADGRIYYRGEDGAMLLIEPSPRQYIERGRFQEPNRSDAPNWTHPVIANGKLYLRDQNVLLCYDIKAK